MRIIFICFLIFILGELIVIIGFDVNGRIGRSVIINCNVNGFEFSEV